MYCRIQFTATTMNQLRRIWKQAYDRGDLPRVRRTSALLDYGQGQEIATIAAKLSVTAETVYAWLRAFLVDRWCSLGSRARPGRQDKLTRTQKQRLRQLLADGPLASGLTCGCWSSLLIQQVIVKEFGVLPCRLTTLPYGSYA